jgi:hypothetical protein
MGVPLPARAQTNLAPPDAEEVALISRAFVSAASPRGGLSPTQRLLVEASVPAMTGYPATFEGPAVTAEEFAHAMARRDLAFRSRMVQNMVLLGLVLRPLPNEVYERIAGFAEAMSVTEDMLAITQRFAAGTLGLAAFDFDRNGYTATWDPADTASLHATRPLEQPWDPDTSDAALAARWRQLEGLPEGTLGRQVTQFYQARGFTYPGLPGSAPPLLAQHDWVHILADYATTVEAELEVFAFIARANDDPHAFSLLAMVVSLFETGYLRAGAGLFEYSPGHLSLPGMATRVADALRRGALCPGSNDFLRTDWFAVAELPTEEVRRRYQIPSKSPEAVRAGSVGPWSPGGLTPYQRAAGLALAQQAGRSYDSHGATTLEDGD